MTTIPQPAPPKPPREPRRLGARDGLLAIAVTALILIVLEGPSIRNQGERLEPGLWRTVVLAVGKPAEALGDVLPLAEVEDDVLGWLSPDDDGTGEGAFSAVAQSNPQAAPGAGPPPVTPEYFDPRALGEAAPKPRELETVLVTGDSLAMPLDSEVARRLSADGVKVERDSRVGTGISKADIGDWGAISVSQVKKKSPDAIVVFIGANEGFPMPKAGGGDVSCCGPDWAAEYASRARRMMDTYRQGGEARLYWVTLPMPRDKDRQRIAKVVNEAIKVAAQPFRAHVRIVDAVPTFTPGDRYRDSMDVDGEKKIVRESDGVHLNGEGAKVLADPVLDLIREDFER